MRKTLLLVALATFLFSACKKEILPLQPAASFLVNGDSSNAITVGTFDGLTLTSNSVNAESFLWDLGDGVTSTSKEFSYYFKKSGTYTVTLTAIGMHGVRASMTKIVIVKDRVLKQIVIPRLNFRSALGFSADFPAGKANLWVEIQKGEPGQSYSLSGSGTFNVPVVLKSDVVPNVDATATPLIINVAQKFIVDFQALTGEDGGKGYGFNLFAQDATGAYLLTSSYASGIGNTVDADIRKNQFTVTTGFEGSEIVLKCDFE